MGETQKFFHKNLLIKILNKHSFNPINIKKIKMGRRSHTFFVICKTKNSQFLQIYDKKLSYQAKKKHYIYSLVRQYTKLSVPSSIYGYDNKIGHYLITEAINGKTYANIQGEVSKKNKKHIMQMLGSYLATIHSSVPIGKNFGWIQTNYVIPQGKSNIEYLLNEAARIGRWLKRCGKKKDAEKIKKYFSVELLKSITINKKPVLVWFDISKKNVLITDKPLRVILIDPGAARAGPKELDLIHAKLYFADTEKEFKYIISGYKKISALQLDNKTLEIYLDYFKADEYAFTLMQKWKDIAQQARDYLVQRGILTRS
jgi:aminoglycoside phosphotransferase (APT) family kinase protein